MFGVNTYIVWDPDTLEAAIVDPGMQSPEECRELDSFITSHKLKPVHLINTHLHIDHTLGDDHVERQYGLSLEAAPADSFLGESRDGQARMFHLDFGELKPLRIGRELADGDTIKIGNGTLEVIAVPGHSPGSVALFSPADRFVITGDALFRGSIGRTDFAGGNDAQMAGSLARLAALEGDFRIFPGHQGATTLEEERRRNPWLRAAAKL